MTKTTDVVIVGAGPCGLFQVFELGLLGLKSTLIDTLPTPGGQCTELYPDKPIYDIPAIPVCDAQELVENLRTQIDPFGPEYLLDQQVTHVERLNDLEFLVKTSAGTELTCKAVVIAGGVGSFQPMPLRIPAVDDFLDQSLYYRVKNPKDHYGKDLVVLGGGDSAFDWALELAQHAKSLKLIHRSDKFRAAPASVAKMHELIAAGKMTFEIGNVTELTGSNGQLSAIQVKGADDVVKPVELDHLLVFFGLSPKLGPIADWGMEMAKNQIPTDTEKFETSEPGIYAVGDIATYPGKKKLILSGFHEGALASFAIKSRIEPDKKVHLQYTTTSPIMHERLGVKE